MSTASWILYGANGYTGALCARRAVESGLSPILAGRRREPVEALAEELGLEARIFALDEAQKLRAAVADTAAVLHCAGPFVRTSRPMVEACLATGTHYLDITGEVTVFETIHQLGDRAAQAAVVLLPGVGFDVVPTDCLAARLAEHLPTATHLELAFAGEGAEWSRGTLKTMVENLPHAGAIRLDGEIVEVPPAYETREIDFPGLGRRFAMTIPWGDVSTAYHSTGIPNIRVFTAVPPKLARRLSRGAALLRLAGTPPVKGLLKAWIGRTVTGPDEATRRTARAHVWGRVIDPDGRTVTGGVSTPEGYSLTARSAVECTRRVLAGEVEPGSHTPSGAFGAGLVATLPGVEWHGPNND